MNAALNGDTDLDILFDYKNKTLVDEILFENSFFRYKSIPSRRFENIEDYIGIDKETGKIVHIHAHFKLILGESGVKSYHLPFEQEIFSKCFKPDDFNIKCISYVDEMLLLLIRITSKISLFRISKNWGNKLTVKQDLKEFNWLSDRVEIVDLIDNCNEKFNIDCSTIFTQFYDKGFTKLQLIKFKQRIKPYLIKYRRYNGFKLFHIKIKTKILSIFYRVNRKFKILDIPTHRTFINKGIIIAILGSDGSGKSTIVPMIKDVFSKKLDVITVYMGSGKGRSSLIRSLLRFFVPKKKTIKASSKDQIINNKLTTFRLLGKIIWGITLAKEKINKLSRILKIRDKGMLVICDRYPQSQIKGYNDGPLLSRIEKSNTYLSKKISSYENKAYSKAEMVSPDLVIKLFASPRILKLRRPNMDFNQIIKKQEGIIKLKFNNNVKVVEINSEEIPERTLVKCMSMINDCIADKYKINRNQDFDK